MTNAGAHVNTTDSNCHQKELDGLVDAWLLNGQGGGRKLDWGEIADCELAEKEWLWIHLDHSP